MHSRTRSLFPFLALPFLVGAIPSAAGPITGLSDPAPAVRATAPAQDAARGAGVVQPEATRNPSATTAVPLTPEEEALTAIRKEAQAQVAELARRAAATSNEAVRLDLHRQAIEIKKQAEMQFLATKISFARSRGDLAAVNQLEMIRENLIHPPARASVPGADSPVKGGAR
ncbi:MAG: hypothetical protein ACREOU_16605 [Candidatus Eiseniibacteriota bacterium]